jgi:hypothetical protein
MVSASFGICTLLIKVGLSDILEGISNRLLRRELESFRGSANDDLDVRCGLGSKPFGQWKLIPHIQLMSPENNQEISLFQRKHFSLGSRLDSSIQPRKAPKTMQQGPKNRT